MGKTLHTTYLGSIPGTICGPMSTAKSDIWAVSEVLSTTKYGPKLKVKVYSYGIILVKDFKCMTFAIQWVYLDLTVKFMMNFINFFLNFSFIYVHFWPFESQTLLEIVVMPYITV